MYLSDMSHDQPVGVDAALARAAPRPTDHLAHLLDASRVELTGVRKNLLKTTLLYPIASSRYREHACTPRPSDS